METIVFSYAESDRQLRKTAGRSRRGGELLHLVSGRCGIHVSTGEEFDGIPGDAFLIPPHLEQERFNLEYCQTVYAVFESGSLLRRPPRKIGTGDDRILHIRGLKTFRNRTVFTLRSRRRP